MSIDISRAAFDPRKRYTSVQMQQGRVILDDDFNEAENIENEDERRAMLDVIGPTGSSDGGFRIQNGRVTSGEIDFDIGVGTLWLGGLRLWNPEEETYRGQDDWLQMPASERAMPVPGRTDLIYLEAWHQPVTAVEDPELFEPALGGADTSARVRLMRRIRIQTGVGVNDCETAWAALTAQWAATHLGVLDVAHQRRVNATLRVGFQEGDPGSLCDPAIAGGYLGAENQTIRVQLVDSTHLTWGFDNASPLYRIAVQTERDVIHLDTPPKDQAHWPRNGQVVEILASSAKLPVQGTTAEMSGFLTTVERYDPETNLLTLVDPVPTDYGEAWEGRYTFPETPPLYMRIWNRGDDTTSPAAIPFGVDPVPLGNTGLNVTLSGTDFVPADHWIIAARPGFGGVLPADFEDGRTPHGVRRFFTPLAIVRWQGPATNPTFQVLHDCRIPFLPLTRLGGCCTYTVGDGENSHGQFSTIQAAVNALPLNGGKVCVLPGFYEEQVSIFNRQHVTIEGCGIRSVIRPPQVEGTYGILISRSQEITIRRLGILAQARPGIVIDDSAVAPAPPPPSSSSSSSSSVPSPPSPASSSSSSSSFPPPPSSSSFPPPPPSSSSSTSSSSSGAPSSSSSSSSSFSSTGESSPPASSSSSTSSSSSGAPSSSSSSTAPAPPPPNVIPGGSQNFGTSTESRRILIEEMVILTVVYPAIASLGGRLFTFRRNQLVAGPLAVPLGGNEDSGRWPTIFLLETTDVLIEENEVIARQGLVANGDVTDGTTSSTATFTHMPMGGIQIGGECERIEIRRNLILRGNGNGISLGSVAYVSVGTDLTNFPGMKSGWRRVTPGWSLGTNSDGCVEVSLQPPPPLDQGGNEMIPVSMGPVSDIRIVDNRIIGMGQAGVAVHRFFEGLVVDSQLYLDFIVTRNVTIEGNTITECLALPIPEQLVFFDFILLSAAAAIGFSLPVALTVRDNVIERNGRSHVDPVCGIFVVLGINVAVERNRIVDNAPRTDSDDPARRGPRGGIFIYFCASEGVETPLGDGVNINRQTGVPCARITGNVVVVPEGRALLVQTQGPTVVTDNQFTSRGVGTAGIGTEPPDDPPDEGPEDRFNADGGVIVFVENNGSSNEFGYQVQSALSGGEEGLGIPVTVSEASGGTVLFADNYCNLDLLASGNDEVVSAVFLRAGSFSSGDDVNAHGNQIVCNLRGDQVGTNLVVEAHTARVNDNRLEETLRIDPNNLEEIIFEGLSADIDAEYGTVTANVTSHCIVATGSPGPLKANNVEIIEALSPGACEGTMFAMMEVNNFFYKADYVTI